MHACTACRCGKGIQDLYNTPQIQTYLGCLPTGEVYPHKPMYQPGCLRKVFYYMTKWAILYIVLFTHNVIKNLFAAKYYECYIHIGTAVHVSLLSL